MTDKQLIKSVKVFLEERLYSYALMISGAWGCGKTIFVNNTLIPEIEKEYKSDPWYIRNKLRKYFHIFAPSVMPTLILGE